MDIGSPASFLSTCWCEFVMPHVHASADRHFRMLEGSSLLFVMIGFVFSVDYLWITYVFAITNVPVCDGCDWRCAARLGTDRILDHYKPCLIRCHAMCHAAYMCLPHVHKI